MRRARKHHLVSECLENMPRDVLRDYPQLIREYIRGERGIYALYKDTKLYYVGLTSNLDHRLKHHLKDRHSGRWDRFSIFIITDHRYMRDLESLFLRIAKPAGNKVQSKFVKATILNRKLKQDIMRIKRREVSDIFGGNPGTMPRESRKHKTDERSGKQPSLAPYAQKRFEIRTYWKATLVKAWVRTDGTINLNGKIFFSPSIAAASVRGKRTVNGWRVWKFRNAKGDWAYLDELRKAGSKS